MKRILVQLENNNIYFKEKKKFTKNQENLLNTNIISDNEITFSDEYIFENEKIVTSFLNELIKNNKIDQAIIYNNSLEEQILKMFKKITHIEKLILKDNVPLSYKMCEHIAKSNIKLLSCSNMQTYLLEYLDKYNVVVEIRDEYLFVSKFMQMNSLSTYSKIFYKRSINIEFNLTENDLDDLEAFFNINKYLKAIHITNYNLEDLKTILEFIKKYKLKNIKITLHHNITNIEDIEFIKKENIRLKKSKNLISLSYSRKFIKDNMLKQTNAQILKLIVFSLLLIVSVSFGYVFINNYFGEREVIKISDEIQHVIENVDTEDIVEEIQQKEDLLVINNYIASLRTINKDTVGWLKVNNTEIDYPVVKGLDNKFYLKQNFKKNYAHSGWIFMDARNKKDMSDDNTVIFGHNIYGSNVMFGTLKRIYNGKWIKDEENLIIKYDSLFGNLEYEIFSYYIIPPYDDYLRINYPNDADRLHFYLMLKNRSEYDFNVELKHDDKILTLSTCEEGGKKRLVVHAKLIK